MSRSGQGNSPRWDTAMLGRKFQRLAAEIDQRIPVYFVHDATAMYLPLALGMIYARLHEHQSGALLQLYRPVPVWDFSLDQMAALASRSGPGVWLFSDYLWTVQANLAVSRAVKQLSPSNVVVHGGPSAPKYEAACERFLTEHPYVDVVVRGEGEVTLCEFLGALHGALLANDLHGLARVPGITFSPQRGGKPLRTGDRLRAAAADLPSPYLGGYFDDYTAPVIAATIETNRGCPYGCTFCDWGSATLQKIRNFDLERVAAELEWIGGRKIKILWIADANFGIFDRDVEIAERIAAVKREHGYPQQVVVNYAKNATRRLAEVVRIFRDAGISGQGIIAIQSTDPDTLATIRRSNIKTERYDELARIFEQEGLPLSTDLMIGLPGSTVDSFKNDLQHYFDRRIAVKAYPTVLLPNSPMADPAYMAEHEIQVDEAQNLISTSSYTAEDRERMLGINKLFNIFNDFGLLRYVLYYLQWEHDVRCVDAIDAAARVAVERRREFPALAWLADRGWPKPIPPQGWPAFYAEALRVIEEELGIARSSTLDLVMQVNERVMPARERSFPDEMELPHDFVKYWRDRWATQEAAPRGNGAGRRLADYPPGRLTVTDPHDQCVALFGDGFLYHMQTIHWELDSQLHSAGMKPKLNAPSDVLAPSLAVPR